MTHRRLNPWVLGAVVLVAAAMSSGATFALWNDAETPQSDTLTSGTLDVSATSVEWYETSADITAAPHRIDPNTFLIRQGDTVEARYTFSTELTGDNMLAGLNIGWPEPNAPDAPETPDQLSLPAGVTGTYRLFHLDGQAEPREIGQATQIGTAITLDSFTLNTDNAGRNDNFEIVVELHFDNLADHFGTTATTPQANLGTFNVTLDQRRTGDGFS